MICTLSMAKDDYLDVTVQLWMNRKVLLLPDLATAAT